MTASVIASTVSATGADRSSACAQYRSIESVGATPGQVVLAWLAGSEPTITPILGGSRVEQLDAALAGIRLELSPEQRAALDAAH